ncbi:hypothetical protein IID24_05260 [Patescibacteria group bacterium]|nr:hypothetical protein [Patescibacteria group bacterium]
MEKFVLFAQPWWVNLAILIPFISYYAWRRNGLFLTAKQLIIVGLFAIGFGFVEAAVVVYLRAAIGLLPGYGGTFSDVARLSSEVHQQAQILGELPRSLLTVELIREAATIIMLASVAFIAAHGRGERWAIFLWTFAIWDIVYYIGLWAIIRWPSSLTTPDVLFLSPVPWLSQVWFPILVSTLTLFAVILALKRQNDSL